MVEKYSNNGGTMKQWMWNSGTMMVEHWKNDSGTVEQ